jgi:hypothetical protein
MDFKFPFLHPKLDTTEQLPQSGHNKLVAMDCVNTVQNIKKK